MIAKNVPDKTATLYVDATHYKLVGIMTLSGIMECLIPPDDLEDAAVLGRTEYKGQLVQVLQLRNGERILYL